VFFLNLLKNFLKELIDGYILCLKNISFLNRHYFFVETFIIRRRIARLFFGAQLPCLLLVEDDENYSRVYRLLRASLLNDILAPFCLCPSASTW